MAEIQIKTENHSIKDGQISHQVTETNEMRTPEHKNKRYQITDLNEDHKEPDFNRNFERNLLAGNQERNLLAGNQERNLDRALDRNEEQSLRKDNDEVKVNS